MQKFSPKKKIFKAASRSNSASPLWGEIQSKACSRHAVDFWKPIHEYQNIFNREEPLNQIDISDSSTLLSEEDRNLFPYDPVVEHTIQLRKYKLEIKKSIQKVENYKPGKAKTVKCRIVPSFPVPDFPHNYPFSDTLQDSRKNKPKVIIKSSDKLSETQVEHQRKCFVQRVLFQNGFNVEDPASALPLQILSNITDRFLRKFVDLLYYNENTKICCESDDLWDTLETTLRDIGYDGISDLHKFYYEGIVRKHDALLEECFNLKNEYQERLKAKLKL